MPDAATYDEYGEQEDGASAPEKAVQPSFIVFMLMLMVAMLKDLLDLIGIGSLPGIGWVVTFMFDIVIGMLVFFDPLMRSGKNRWSKIAKRIGIIGVTGLIEGLAFGLNLLPMETGMVVLMYILAKKEAKKENRENARKTTRSV